MPETHWPWERLLVANRGEIAARIVCTARELGLRTFVTYTDGDIGHTFNASRAVRLTSPSAYTDIDEILRVASEHRIQAIHPGYGYLSESAHLARRAAEVGILVIGPGADILANTGDKLAARLLAQRCKVPVLPALTEPTCSPDAVLAFAEQHGYPIMVKAVDGGGGRGIRLVTSPGNAKDLITRAIEESPSRQVFAERAAVDGCRHVEVQIIGDGQGNVMHLWERDCSIQRRFQKVIESAPSTVNRSRIAPLIVAAVGMAKEIRYRSLATFEFLLHDLSGDFFFLEINPRLQVEHTITESICNRDIVDIQLQLALGASFSRLGLSYISQDPLTPPPQCAIQLRVTAEDPERNWVLSAGKIASFRLPQGNGVRVDTALVQGAPNTVSPSFDSVVAKIIVTAADWDAVVSKARRALEDISIVGIRTNIDMLRAITATQRFAQAAFDTQWLEREHDNLVASTKKLTTADPLHGLAPAQNSEASTVSMSSSATLFRRDDAWSATLTPLLANEKPQESTDNHLRLHKVLRNDFPTLLKVQLTWTGPSSAPHDYLLELKATAASAAAIGAQHRRGDPKNASHVIIPFAGKLVEICVDEGDVVKKGDCVAVVQQMKMELEVRSQVDGTVAWLCEIADGEDVAEGVLAAIVEEREMASTKL